MWKPCLVALSHEGKGFETSSEASDAIEFWKDIAWKVEDSYMLDGLYINYQDTSRSKVVTISSLVYLSIFSQNAPFWFLPATIEEILRKCDKVKVAMPYLELDMEKEYYSQDNIVLLPA